MEDRQNQTLSSQGQSNLVAESRATSYYRLTSLELPTRPEVIRYT